MAVSYTDGYNGIKVGPLVENLNSFGAEVVAEFESNEARFESNEERLDNLEKLLPIMVGSRVTESAYSLTTTNSLITILGVSPTISNIDNDGLITYDEATGKIIFAESGIYKFIPILSISSANGAIVTFSYAKNGTVLTLPTPDWFLQGTTIYQNASGYDMFGVEANDYFQVYGKADGARTLNIKEANIIVEKIKG